MKMTGAPLEEQPVGSWCVYWAKFVILGLLGIHGIVNRAHCGQANFFASPWRVREGDEVRFQSVGVSNSTASVVVAWSWDFNGDDVEDATGVELTNGNQISSSWFATVDQAQVRDGFQSILPRFTVVYSNTVTALLSTNRQVGMTEYLYGPPGTITSNLIVQTRSSGNPDLELRVTANPRLVLTNAEVKFFAEVTPRVQNLYGTPEIRWRFGHRSYVGDKDFDVTNTAPRFSYKQPSTNSVEVHVDYRVRLASGAIESRTLVRTNVDFVNVVVAPLSLTLGRAYRRGFPSEYDWDDIVKAYSAEGNGGDRYSYFHHLQRAYQEVQAALGNLSTNTNPGDKLRLLKETVNEMVQGQALLGNKRLVEALRIKYPRLTDPSEAQSDRLPEPPGVRDETKAIDVALLDFEAGISMALEAFGQYGTNAFRPRAEPGREPFPEFPGYITFSDPSLGQVPIPMKNEMWQLSGAMEKAALGTVEKAKKLFRLSLSDTAARGESKEECKKAGLRGYLGMAVLAAVQTPEDFAANKGNDLLAHVKNARDLFEQINAGLNPLGNDGSFVPNESFVAIYEDAREAVADAREAEIRAREEDRTFDRNQADLRNELQSQRAQFITPLVNLTGIDPADYNGLKTYEDQLDYRNTVLSRLAQVRSGNVAPNGFGELGLAVAAEGDSKRGIAEAEMAIRDIEETIRLKKLANDSINGTIRNTAFQTTTLQLIHAIIDGNAGQTFGLAANARAAFGAVLGELDNQVEWLKTLQTIEINNINSDLEIRKLAMDANSASLHLARSRTALSTAELSTERLLSQMDRLIEDLANARDTASNLYFQDPSFRVVVSRAQRRAEGELDFAIDRLYRLAKTLEYEWTEAYKNPVIIPVNCNEPASLENPLFDKFGALEDLFIVRTADEAKDYLDALRAWDSKLRRINVTSVRGPNHAGPITAEPISIREDILNLQPEETRTLADSVLQFRDYLESRLRTNRFNPVYPSLEFEYATGIADNSLFPATGSRWNMRIHSIAIDLIGDNGLSRKQVAEVDLAMSGMTTLRRFYAEPPEADDLFNLTFNLGRRDRSAYGIVVPARINGATGGRPASEFTVLGLQGRPIAATRWIFTLDTTNPSNRDLDVRKLKDIIVRFTYTYGNPPEFPGF